MLAKQRCTRLFRQTIKDLARNTVLGQFMLFETHIKQISLRLLFGSQMGFGMLSVKTPGAKVDRLWQKLHGDFLTIVL